MVVALVVAVEVQGIEGSEDHGGCSGGACEGAGKVRKGRVSCTCSERLVSHLSLAEEGTLHPCVRGCRGGGGRTEVLRPTWPGVALKGQLLSLNIVFLFGSRDSRCIF